MGLVAALVVLGACGRRGSPFLDADRGSTEVEVIDATTLRIEGDLVRLADVSAPRPAPRARCWAEALLAREAVEALRAQTDYVRDVEIVPAGEGRARVLVDGRDLSRMLVDHGLAARTGEGWDWCGPLTLDAPRAPRLGYPVAPAAPRQGGAATADGLDEGRVAGP